MENFQDRFSKWWNFMLNDHCQLILTRLIFTFFICFQNGTVTSNHFLSIPFEKIKSKPMSFIVSFSYFFIVTCIKIIWRFNVFFSFDFLLIGGLLQQIISRHSIHSRSPYPQHFSVSLCLCLSVCLSVSLSLSLYIYIYIYTCVCMYVILVIFAFIGTS